MPETPKNKPEVEKKKKDERQKDSWGEDQKAREYYYDDAHGYETYKPEKEDEQDDDEA
ncbi:MAG: hypothetical protein ACKVRN_02850 [Pyrinomonadaceae bacterium]